MVPLSIFVYGSYETTQAIVRAGSKVSHPKKKLPIELLVSDMTQQLASSSERKSVLFFQYEEDIQKTGKFKWREKFYFHQLRPYLQYAAETEVAKRMISSHVAFAVTPLKNAQTLLNLEAPCAYGTIPIIPKNKRERQLQPELLVAAYGNCEQLKHFQGIPHSYSFGSRDIQVLYGIGKPGELARVPIRWTNGPRSAFVIQGNSILQKFGAKINLRAIPHQTLSNEQLELELFLNEQPIGVAKFQGNAFASFEFLAPGDSWVNGKNIITLRPSVKDPSLISSTKLVVGLEYLRVTPLMDRALAP